MTLSDIHLMIRREVGAVRREVEAYPDDDSLWIQVPGLPNTGGTLALHLAGNLQHYFGAVLGKTGYVRDREAEFARRNVSRAEILRELDAAVAAVDRTVPKITEAILAAPYPELVGKRRMATSVFLTHLAVHLAYHLGQLDFHRRAATRDARGIDAVSIRELPEVA